MKGRIARALALTLLLLACVFRIRDDGATWLWTDTPAIGIALFLAGAALWLGARGAD